jgi:hypothetical protein
VSPGAWAALAALVGRLVAVATRAGLEPGLRWQLRALERAVGAQAPELLPLGLGATGRTPPAAVEAWRHDRAVAGELAEVAVWMVADAGCELAGGGEGDVAGAGVAVGAWDEG